LSNSFNNVAQPAHLRKVLDLFDQVRDLSDGGWMARCPAHDDRNPSLSIHLGHGGNILLYCHTGCKFPDILSALGITKDDLRPPAKRSSSSSTSSRREIVATYDYKGADGRILFRVCRTEPKGFFQLRPNGNGGWLKGLGGIEPVLYRLPEVVRAVKAGETIYITEGEKDADNLTRLGLAATTSPMGAEKWRTEYSAPLEGAEVVVLPDNDEPGHKHAEQVARGLVLKAKSIKVLNLPGLDPKGDVSDWLAAGGTKEQLLELVAECPEWEPSTVASTNGHNGNGWDSRPRIEAGRDIPIVSEQAAAIMLAANQQSQRWYKRGRLLVKLVPDAKHGAILVPFDQDIMRGELARLISWYTVTKHGERDAEPPTNVVRDLLAFPLEFPEINSIVQVPTYDQSWQLELIPGYHPVSKNYYVPSVSINPIPAKPTKQDAQWALDLLLNHVFVDFAFASRADLAHALALTILPFVRSAIKGPTPLHLVEANSQGAGKGLLVKTALSIGLGPGVWSSPTVNGNEDEIRKGITTGLTKGYSVFFMDNLTALFSPTLAAAITEDGWVDRILGRTDSIEMPINWIWAATGNNLKVSQDFPRRSLLIRLVPAEWKPWRRPDETFRHPDLRGWVSEHRAELVEAVLILIQSWVAAGKPTVPITPMGSFENWSRVMGSILAFHDVKGFLENREALFDAADATSAMWEEFTSKWWERHSDKIVGVSELYEVAKEVESLDIGARTADERAQKMSLGKRLQQQLDRIYGDYQILAGEKHKGKRQWCLRRASPQTTTHHKYDDNGSSVPPRPWANRNSELIGPKTQDKQEPEPEQTQTAPPQTPKLS